MCKFTILNTRPKHQSQTLSQFVEETLHVNCVDQPLLDILPLPKASWLQVDKLNSAKLIIFTSPNAVKLSMPHLKSALTTSASIAAIGPTTKQCLEQAGLQVDLQGQQANSESFLAQKKLSNFYGKDILIIKGAGGRELLREHFIKHSCCINEFAVYQRACPQFLGDNLKKIWKKHLINLILIHSVDALTNLINQTNGQLQEQIKQTACLVLSERIKQVAVQNGFSNVITASENHMEQSIRAYLNYRKTL